MEDFSKYLLKADTPGSSDTPKKYEFSENLVHTPVGVFCEGNENTDYSRNVGFEDTFTYTPCAVNQVFDADADPKGKMTFSIEDEIAELECNIENLMSYIRENGVKDTIVSKYYKKNGVFLKKIEEIARRINENYEQHKNNLKASKPTYYARDLRFQEGTSCTETSCMRSVREICESISSHFNKEYFSEDGLKGFTMDGDTSIKQQIWTNVEDILHKHSPSEIFEALVKNIQQSTDNLNDLCSRIDLKRDAESLKLKFETGRLKDLSSGPALLKTVNELIEMGQVSHFQQFVACEDSKNKSCNTMRKLQALNGEIDGLLEEKFDSRLAAVIKKYFNAEQENSSCKASYHYLREELARLHDEEKEKEAMKTCIEGKYNKIQNFDKTVQKKQVIIQKLVQINGSAKSRHRQQQGEIIRLVEEKILKKKKEISQLYKKYQELVNEEMDVFIKIPIQNLHSFKQASAEKRLVSEMSINYLKPQFHHAGDDTLKHILKKVNMPSYSAPEKVISNIRDMHHNCYINTLNANSSEAKAKEVSDVHEKLDHVTEQLAKIYKEQFQSLLPSVKRSEQKASQIMGESLKFQNAVQTWWQQPAQNVVPWVSVDGFNIQQYNEQFSMQGELLKQIRDGNIKSKLE